MQLVKKIRNFNDNFGVLLTSIFQCINKFCRPVLFHIIFISSIFHNINVSLTRQTYVSSISDIPICATGILT
jgi:hypothetical protein